MRSVEITEQPMPNVPMEQVHRKKEEATQLQSPFLMPIQECKQKHKKIMSTRDIAKMSQKS